MTDAADPLTFDGFSREAFRWFAGLEADNSKPYFTSQRQTYDRAVRGAFEAMLELLADDLGGHVKLFRQHRDVRFSPDKSPYKTTTYGLIVDREESRAALYAQLSSAGLFAGTGYYMLARDQLTRLRAAIDDDASGPALEAAIATAESAGLELFAADLKTAPRGYARDHPRVHLLRHKSLVAGRRLDPGPDGITASAALEHARSTWGACSALNAWLDQHVGESDIPPESRFGRR
jgi:uncharacterized protein (TIGR02453 family)